MTKKYKNYLLIFIVFISQIHIIFRDSGINVDLFLLIDKQRSLNFSVFILGVYIRFIICFYCLLKPKDIDKMIIKFLLTLSVFDVFHFFLTSGLGYGLEKIIAVFLFLFLRERFFKWLRCLSRGRNL